MCSSFLLAVHVLCYPLTIYIYTRYTHKKTHTTLAPLSKHLLLSFSCNTSCIIPVPGLLICLTVQTFVDRIGHRKNHIDRILYWSYNGPRKPLGCERGNSLHSLIQQSESSICLLSPHSTSLRKLQPGRLPYQPGVSTATIQWYQGFCVVL